MTTKTPTDRLDVFESVDPDDYTSTQTGSSVDLQNYDGAMVLIATGDINGTTSLKVEHSVNDSDWDDVPAAKLNGSLSDLSADEIQSVDYTGSRRYIRISSTAAGTSPSDWTGLVVATSKRQKP
jgi:hypothetical protein